MHHFFHSVQLDKGLVENIFFLEMEGNIHEKDYDTTTKMTFYNIAL